MERAAVRPLFFARCLRMSATVRRAPCVPSPACGRAIAYDQLQPMVVVSHNLSAGRPCERRDPSPLASKVKKGLCSSAETRVRAVWVPAFAGTTHRERYVYENSMCDNPPHKGEGAHRHR